MAIVTGTIFDIITETGRVTITVMYEDTTGIPVEITTYNSTGRPYRVRLATGNGSVEAVAIIQPGTHTVTIAIALRNLLDFRRYGDDVDELPPPNPKPWRLDMWI